MLVAMAAISFIFICQGFVRVNYPRVYTEADNNTTVTVSPDTIIEIRLHERAESGLIWGINVSDGLVLERDIVFPLFPDTITGIRRMVLNPYGIHRFNLRAVSPGMRTIECILANPREPPVKRFVLYVNVIGTVAWRWSRRTRPLWWSWRPLHFA